MYRPVDPNYPAGHELRDPMPLEGRIEMAPKLRKKSGLTVFKGLFSRQSERKSRKEKKMAISLPYITEDQQYPLFPTNPSVHPLHHDLGLVNFSRNELYSPEVLSPVDEYEDWTAFMSPHLVESTSSPRLSTENSFVSDYSSQLGQPAPMGKGSSQDIRASMQREDFVPQIAADDESEAEWDDYLRLYAEGRLDLTYPPPPPPMQVHFLGFLPALYPTANNLRQPPAKACAAFWASWNNGHLCSLQSKAERKFNVRGVAISYFDTDKEVVRSEHGFGGHLEVDRSESIAAHALLTPEGMAIMDSQKDWRFTRNPLVVGKPKMRFYAGTPMFSTQGGVVGILSIFDSKPMNGFPDFKRRELADLATEIINGYTKACRHQNEKSARSTPILHRHSLFSHLSENVFHRDIVKDSGYHSGRRNSSTAPSVYGMSPRPHRGSSVTTFDTFELTPPTSDDDFESRIVPTGFGKNPKQLLIYTSEQHEHDADADDEMTFDSPSYPPYPNRPPPRPFSGSDLTSVDQTLHPNTPIDWDIDDFFCGRAEVAVSHASTINSSGHSIQWEHDFDAVMARDSWPLRDSEITKYHHSLKAAIPRGLRIEHKESYAKPSHAGYPHSQLSREHTPMAEAMFAAKFAALKLHWDSVYVLELLPAKAFESDEELLAPNGTKMRVLAEYGVPQGCIFDPKLHLSVIRGSGLAIWNDNRPSCAYARGFMMRLKSWGTTSQQTRSAGIVYVALKAERESFLPESEERKCLINAAKAMGEILKTGRPRRNTGPPSPNISPEDENPFKANEARELKHIKNRSLDTTMILAGYPTKLSFK